MNKEEAREYVEHRLCNYMGRGDEIMGDIIKGHEFCNKVTTVINELLHNHHFIILSDFSDSFRLKGVMLTDEGFERIYEKFK